MLGSSLVPTELIVRASLKNAFPVSLTIGNHSLAAPTNHEVGGHQALPLHKVRRCVFIGILRKDAGACHALDQLAQPLRHLTSYPRPTLPARIGVDP